MVDVADLIRRLRELVAHEQRANREPLRIWLGVREFDAIARAFEQVGKLGPGAHLAIDGLPVIVDETRPHRLEVEAIERVSS